MGPPRHRHSLPAPTPGPGALSPAHLSFPDPVTPQRPRGSLVVSSWGLSPGRKHKGEVELGPQGAGGAAACGGGAAACGGGGSCCSAELGDGGRGTRPAALCCGSPAQPSLAGAAPGGLTGGHPGRQEVIEDISPPRPGDSEHHPEEPRAAVGTLGGCGWRDGWGQAAGIPEMGVPMAHTPTFLLGKIISRCGLLGGHRATGQRFRNAEHKT